MHCPGHLARNRTAAHPGRLPGRNSPTQTPALLGAPNLVAAFFVYQTGMRIRTWPVVALAVLGLAPAAAGCTAFTASIGRTVLVGNNEDDNNPFTVLWFVPPSDQSLGRLYVGFDDFQPQGGMNQKGLWFDAFATSFVPAKSSAGKPKPNKLIDRAMAECATVDQVIRLFEQYDRGFMAKAVVMFADASGDSVVIEPDAMVRRSGAFQVQTNFHQSFDTPEYDCQRFRTATEMLRSAGDRIDVELFRRILEATHSTRTYPTVYSNIFDLKRRVMYLYDFHNYRQSVRIELDRELRKGARAVSIPGLFRQAPAAAAYRKTRAAQLKRAEPPVVTVDPRILNAYCGSWRLDNGVHFKVLKHGRRLMLEADPLGRVEMYPESPTRFFLRITHAWISFERSADGRVDRVLAFVNGAESHGRRVQ
jgi:hypothetical protein